MPTVLRARQKNLRCFYCGRRSDTQFSGQASFECKYCEATNWLDENGTITDPPVTTTTSDETTPAAPRFSTSFSSSFTSDPVERATSPIWSPPDAINSADSIFCAKCQRNQELLSRTLKEYEFPDDPNDPEYAIRTKGYRKWKNDLEARYPQVCAECEPKVEQQLQKASYTAKTDHMRRMINRTKERRHQARKQTTLDYVDLAGKWSWHVAFVLQFMWHLTVLGALFIERDGQGLLENWAIALLRTACVFVLNMLPSSAVFLKWAINMSLVAFAWNPRFKQAIRGFTSHILGFRQWYTYQLVILLIRCACLFLSQYNDVNGIPAAQQIGAHLVIGWLMFYVHKVAGKSIRTDNTPLFGSRQSLYFTQPSPAPSNPLIRSDDLGGILDEIMESSPKVQTSRASTPQSFKSPHQPVSTGRRVFRNGSIDTPSRPGQRQGKGGFSKLNFASSPTSFKADDQPMRDRDEMDWSPSGSQHRAFSTHNPFKVKNPNPRFNDTPLGFNDTPIEPKSGPFWYKVPPAPTNPAQRLRNPVQPVIRESPKETQQNFFSSSGRTIDLTSGSQDPGSSFTLRDAQFHAPAARDDPRDGLSNMMGSFSISPDPEERRATSGGAMNGSMLASNGHTSVARNIKVRTAELLVLFGAFWAWATALGTQESYGPTMGLGAICASLIVSIRLTADLLVDVQMRQGKQPSLLRPSWANLGYAQVLAALVLVWKVWSGSAQGITCGVYGNALLGGMIAHQFWHVFS
ncbi:Ima1 N-terminal domain-containing protein [Truncatella angustata]|uniref:Ima1 N-terminal domain-containing protein n=1 Tax=Truncatella angustata TaxID=152316 RepID=A0A9P8USI4_9PEZI|nr:Ima1 N-terminal domain-containing protein [Truncatella angustata]KAH6657657.1 Ima1 N-terminal domain-containing protein [Truncatella angustata]KAH8195922.1 hypothetical protein TruAng_009901 [Truncatella angustata]